MNYILDTNVISDLVNPVPNPNVTQRLRERYEAHNLYLCEPIIYEIERGWLHSSSQKKLKQFREDILPRFTITPVILKDWRAAATLWAEARRKGFQLSDIDLLLAAITVRLGGILVSADEDFSILPIQRENWRV